MRTLSFMLAAVSVSACQSPAPAAPAPTLVAGPNAAAELAPFIAAELAKPAGDKRLLVYVGATWCEPCQYFHRAAEAHALDTAFPDLTLLEFDLDDDRDRLESAGYKSQLIPLFVMPSADGRASENRFEGSVKGNAAVSNIAPRLRSLLATR